MAGNHKAAHSKATGSSRLLKLLASSVAIVLTLAGSFFVVNNFLAGCTATGDVTVATDPSLEPVIDRLVRNSPAEDLECANVNVKAVDPAQQLAAMGSGQKPPAVWIPDSTLWLARLGQATGLPVDIVAESAATTPAVVIGQENQPPKVASWLEVLKLDKLGLGDPLSSSVSSAPIIASLAENTSQQQDPKVVAAAMVPLAQAQLSKAPVTKQSERIDQVQSQGGAAIVTEQAVASHTPGGIATTVPPNGSVFLNFPIAATEPTSGDHDKARNVAKAIDKLLSSADGQRALSSAGFRPATGAALSNDRGVGKIASISVTDQSAVSAALKKYALLALPTRALAVEDVSGSMAFDAGGRTRMALTIKASETGISLFPDNSQVGLWSFSTQLDGNKDYKPILPIKRLNEDVNGTPHRKKLTDAIGDLKPKANGSTGLYDTTLAAFREVKKTYDPKAINSVILLTDGANEDPGSISLKKLIATLKKEQDPTRPVVIITIGITEDADAKVLKEISVATGGTSYVARDPADIPSVFITALQNRAG